MQSDLLLHAKRAGHATLQTTINPVGITLLFSCNVFQKQEKICGDISIPSIAMSCKGVVGDCSIGATWQITKEQAVIYLPRYANGIGLQK